MLEKTLRYFKQVIYMLVQVPIDVLQNTILADNCHHMSNIFIY